MQTWGLDRSATVAAGDWAGSVAQEIGPGAGNRGRSMCDAGGRRMPRRRARVRCWLRRCRRRVSGSVLDSGSSFARVAATEGMRWMASAWTRMPTITISVFDRPRIATSCSRHPDTVNAGTRRRMARPPRDPRRQPTLPQAARATGRRRDRCNVRRAARVRAEPVVMATPSAGRMADGRRQYPLSCPSGTNSDTTEVGSERGPRRSRAGRRHDDACRPPTRPQRCWNHGAYGPKAGPTVLARFDAGKRRGRERATRWTGIIVAEHPSHALHP